MTVLLPQPLVLESIDLDIPCDGPRCDAPAKWVVHWDRKAYECCGEPAHLICDTHFAEFTDALQKNLPGVCGMCRTLLGTFRDLVISIEPL